MSTNTETLANFLAAVGEKSWPEAKKAFDMSPEILAFGGATTWEELDAFFEAREIGRDITANMHQFEMLTDNVIESDDIPVTEKAGRIRQLLDGLMQRLQSNPGHTGEDDEKAAGTKQETKREDGVDFPASDFAYVPDPESPSTWKLRLADGSPGNVTVQQVARAITALQPSGFRGQRVQIPSDDRAEVIRRIQRAIGRTDGNDDQKENLRDRLDAVKSLQDASFVVTSGSFSSFKDRAGEQRWLAVFTNKYRDRDGEIFPDEAHKAFVDSWTKEQPAIELRLWHVPGTAIGYADTVAYDDHGFVIASGTYTKDALDRGTVSRLEEYAKQVALGCSHGYHYPRDGLKGGVYAGGYETFEVSILPMEWASNPLTAFTVVEEDTAMPLNPAQRPFLEAVLTEPQLKALEQEIIPAMAKKAEEEGVDFKSVPMGALFEMDQANSSDGSGDTDPEGAGGESHDATQNANPAPSGEQGKATTEGGSGESGDDQKDAGQTVTPEQLAAAIKEVVQPLADSVRELQDAQKQLSEGVLALAEKDESKVKDLLRPKGGYGAAVEALKHAASRSDATKVGDNDQLVQDAQKNAATAAGAGFGDPDRDFMFGSLNGGSPQGQ
ncbi:MAG: hypothetical protein ACOC9T_01030 [Myxococcota bacterium]